VAGGWIKQHSDDLHTSFFQNIIVVINAMGQNGLDFSTIKQMIKAKKNFVRKTEKKIPRGKPRRWIRWKDNINIHI
jgi:hypothetical protein